MVSAEANAESQHQAQHPENEPPARRWYWDKQLRLFDALLTVVSAVGLFLLAYQSYEIRRTNQLGIEANRLTEQAMVNQGRAWLTVEEVTFDGIGIAGSTVFAHATIKNTGQSPALNIRVHGAVTSKTGEGTDTNDLDFSSAMRDALPTPGSMRTVSVLGASEQASTGRSAERRNDPNDLIWLDRNQLRYYVWGLIEYEDIFGRHRTTEYCYRTVRPDPLVTLKFQPGKYGAQSCDGWNNAQ